MDHLCIDDEPRDPLIHLGTIRILYYVLAGMTLPVLLLIGLHALMFLSIFSMDLPVPPDAPEGPDPREMFGRMMPIFIAFYAVAGFSLIAYGTCCLLLAQRLGRRDIGTGTKVLTAISCIWIPFGTALGAWTLITIGNAATPRR